VRSKIPGKIPALQVRLTLRDAKTGQRILPAYYDDNYFSLMPGEHQKFKIETRDPVEDVRVDITGWNIEAISLQ
jgi:mannosylglycoprotein endo-beta-mannosidase